MKIVRMLCCRNVFLFLVIILVSCQKKTGFVIEGTIDFPKHGNILVITPSASDTFAKAPIVNGKFILTGSIDTITEAAVIPEGQRMGSFPFFLENSPNTFKAELHMKDSIHDTQITGGGIQDIAATFRRKSVEYNRYRLDPIIASINQANRIGDYKAIDSLRKKYYEVIKLGENCEDSLLRVYNDTYVAAYLINLKFRGDYQLLQEKSRLLGDNAWNTTYGKVIKETLERYKKLECGKVAPDFQVTTPIGEKVSIHDIEGKVKLLNFTAIWSRACSQENMVLNELYKKYHDEGLEIIDITLSEHKKSWLDAIERRPLSWKQVADLSQTNNIKETYIIAAYPTNYLLDSNNRIIGRNVRGEELQRVLSKRLH